MCQRTFEDCNLLFCIYYSKVGGLHISESGMDLPAFSGSVRLVSRHCYITSLYIVYWVTIQIRSTHPILLS